jgi:hypothetical protein
LVRKWVTGRALVFHLLLVVIVGGCSIAAWWQFGRAAQGNALSYLYSVEWPVFGIVAIVGWWQLIHEDPADVQARKEERLRRGRPNPIGYDTELLRRELAAHPELLDSFPELARAYPELAAPADAGAPAASPGGEAGQGITRVPVVATEGAEVDSPPGEEGAEVPIGASKRVQEYNDMLAAYAARGRAKSWRHPRGR